ncbi:MAG TPA: glycosyltransferase family 2 protein [Bacteroidales bacterium]|nr:glycosyltransferase family 2 protein [Bacteroidales bacterium]HRZ21249.1 glycosyltransferase family 2 protein [Bacteroidales bacterium]
MYRILAVIPAFNEQETVSGLLESLSHAQEQLPFDILVINDASADETGQLARRSGLASVIDLPCNLGVGGAVQTGFLYGLKNNYDIVFQFDADGQHRSDEIFSLLDPLWKGEADVVIGSRFLKRHTGYRSTWGRRVGIRLLEFMTRILIRQVVTDCTSGFRAYNRSAIEFLAEHYPVDFPEPEAVILLGKHGFRMKEVFTPMNERMGGRSSITFLRGPYYMVKVMLSMMMVALRRSANSKSQDPNSKQISNSKTQIPCKS